jgi:cell division protein FtsB
LTEATGFPEFKRRKDRSALQILNRIILGLVVLLMLIAMLAGFYPALKSRSDQRAALARIKGEVETAQLLYQRNTRDVVRLKNDPEYLGLIARDKLDLMNKGETIFRFDSANPAATPQVR